MITIVEGGKPISRIFTGPGLEGLADLLKDYSQVYVVCDRNVMHCAERICSIANCSKIKYLEATEETKDISTVLEICSWLLENGADRNAFVLAVGGGITTDMAGFAASIYKRGIRFGYVPTTLLAMVDAAIGGKTGVNFEDYKNIIGVIRQPEFTYECAEVLATLPYRDFVSGVAEMFKTFIIENVDDNYRRAVKVLSAIHAASDYSTAMQEHLPELQHLIEASASVKAGVVSRDQFEKGERRMLNLGHTFAHAIEHAARENNAQITHGEAVAIGTVLAARLSEKLGVCHEGLAEQLKEDFEKAGLPCDSPYPAAELVDAMHKDKKANGSKVKFVLIERIGKTVEMELAPEEAVDIIL